jgi:hypothetical protein
MKLGGFEGMGAAHPGHLKWQSWTMTRAEESGTFWIDSCKPDCAHGTYKPRTVKVVAFRPEDGHFARLALRYHGPSRAKSWGSRRSGGSWSYYLMGR